MSEKDFWEGCVPEPVKPAQQALDEMAWDAKELGLNYEPVWGGGHTNKDYEDAMRQRRLHQLTTPPDAFEQLRREADKPTQVPESIAKYAAALVAGTHEITSLTIRPKRTWVELTDEERVDLWKATETDNRMVLIEAIEAKLKEKNT